MKRILIVEDSEDIVNLLTFCLKNEGFEVFVAQDGLEGLEKAKQEVPDLIVLDLGLPLLSGEEVCKEIKEGDNAKCRKIPILMLTGKGADADRVLGKVLGADQYVTKPFDIYDLLQKIEGLTGDMNCSAA